MPTRAILRAVAAFVHGLFRSRLSMQLEILALRHQLAVYQRTAARPRLRPADRILWAWLSRVWADWQDALVFVKPETVIAWRRRKFRAYWTKLSRSGRPGRPAIHREVRDLIRRMSIANPLWGAPRIVAELAKIGIDLHKSTVDMYMARQRKPPSTAWRAFLKNHIKDIAAVDFFVVPTVKNQILFVFLVLAHERRRVLHFNVTSNPTAALTGQQVLEAFPWVDPPKYLLRDRDGIHGHAFSRRVRRLGCEEILIAPRSPWQNPFVERLVGSIRRECLDHTVVLGERHLKRILTDYSDYYHRWRTHQAPEMDCPESREVHAIARGLVIEVEEVGGLHHHYERDAA